MSTTPMRATPPAPAHRIPRTRAAGIALAFVTAVVSGVAVFVNADAVARFPDATTYTTAKNLVAAVVLCGLWLGTGRPVRPPADGDQDRRPHRPPWLALVGIVGGSVPFVLFFEGLARTTSVPAAFVHKTLVVWVALLAIPLLGERFDRWHAAAVAALVVGQALLVGNVADLRPGAGEAMILAATLLCVPGRGRGAHGNRRRRPAGLGGGHRAGRRPGWPGRTPVGLGAADRGDPRRLRRDLVRGSGPPQGNRTPNLSSRWRMDFRSSSTPCCAPLRCSMSWSLLP
jgi:uncharacterized membrane protein